MLDRRKEAAAIGTPCECELQDMTYLTGKLLLPRRLRRLGLNGAGALGFCCRDLSSSSVPLSLRTVQRRGWCQREPGILPRVRTASQGGESQRQSTETSFMLRGTRPR